MIAPALLLTLAAAAAPAAASNADATLDQLVVIVRPSNPPAAGGAPATDPAKAVPPRPFAGDLALFLAVDSPGAIRLAVPADLARWHLDAAAAWDRARINIKARIGELQQIRLGDANGPDGIGAASGLAPSLLATDEACSPAQPDGIAGQVVLLVSRDSYIFGTPADPQSMARFWGAARSIVDRYAAFSTTPITCRNGSWVPAPLP